MRVGRGYLICQDGGVANANHSLEEDEEELFYVLTLQAIAGRLSPCEYAGAAVPGGAGAPPAGRGRV